MVTSSMPSLPINVHPSSVKPFKASLKPLTIKYQFQNEVNSEPSKERHHRTEEDFYLLNLWLSARRAAGRLAQLVTLVCETSCAICLKWRNAYMKKNVRIA